MTAIAGWIAALTCQIPDYAKAEGRAPSQFSKQRELGKVADVSRIAILHTAPFGARATSIVFSVGDGAGQT